ncbi:MAG: SDR family oxidoreductase [Alphaproteobacteria bacterium]|nr:SDR family oxidoreductase [Alphaproteobacteria bacterium]
MGEALDGKTAFVTAAGQGIGRAIALALAGEGARVTATDINEAALQELRQADGDIAVERLDVCDASAIAAAAARAGAVDILVNCAGWVAHGSILACSDEDWKRSFDINVTSMFHTIKAFLPQMIEAGGGSIVNISSVASSVKGVPDRLAYGASKAAVIGLTKAVAADFVAKGIRCNAICPGTVESPSLEQRMRARPNYEEARKAFIARQPMGRLGEPEEIAALALFLALPQSAYMTGQAISMDGGMTI